MANYVELIPGVNFQTFHFLPTLQLCVFCTLPRKTTIIAVHRINLHVS